MTNTNYVSVSDAMNTNESEQYIICFGNKEKKIICYILPLYRFTTEFRKGNNIGLVWREYFYDPEQAKEELKQFDFDTLIFIE